jgi:hypothetical protein
MPGYFEVERKKTAEYALGPHIVFSDGKRWMNFPVAMNL